MIFFMKQYTAKLKKNALRLAIPILFFGFVFSIIHPSKVAGLLANADLTWFIMGFVSAALVNYLSALRTRWLLFHPGHPMLILWHIHALRAFITGLLPFNTGELSYVYYLKKYCVTPAAKGLAVLVSVRCLELVFFLAVQFILAGFGLLLNASVLNLTAVFITGAALFTALLAIWKKEILIRLPGFFSKRFSGCFGFGADKFSRMVDEFSQGIALVFEYRQKIRLAGLTLAIVLLKNLFMVAMVCAMGAEISLWLVVYLILFIFAAQFVQGFGSFGNQEAGISGALIAVGYEPEQALAMALGAHLLQWIPVLGMGMVSYAGLRYAKHQNP